MLTADDAYEIARKLDAQPYQAKRHIRVNVILHGHLIGSYGIQRGSREHSHDYISKQLGLTSREARDLAHCPLSKEELIQLLIQRGKLPPPA